MFEKIFATVTLYCLIGWGIGTLYKMDSTTGLRKQQAVLVAITWPLIALVWVLWLIGVILAAGGWITSLPVRAFDWHEWTPFRRSD